MMSGTDLSMFGFLEPYWRPREYARELAEILGCPIHHSYDMMECLRDNATLSWHRFRDVQHQIHAKVGDHFWTIWSKYILISLKFKDPFYLRIVGSRPKHFGDWCFIGDEFWAKSVENKMLSWRTVLSPTTLLCDIGNISAWSGIFPCPYTLKACLDFLIATMSIFINVINSDINTKYTK